MSKSNQSRNGKRSEKFNWSELFHLSSSSWGGILLGFALFLFLSLWTFQDGSARANWFGLLGHIFSASLQLLFGWGSYLLVIYVAGLGGSLVKEGNLNPWKRRSLLLIPLMISICLLLAVFSHRGSSWIERNLGASVYSDYVDEGGAAYNRQLRFFMGGKIADAIYWGGSRFSLRTLLNDFGVAFLSSALLIFSLSRLFHIPLGSWIKSGILTLSQKMERTPYRPKEKKESAFARWVKLRGSTPPSFEDAELSHHEILAISPEKELTHRPSISAKEELEQRYLPNSPQAEKGPMPPPPQAPIEATTAPPPSSRRQEALRAQKVHNGNFQEFKLPEAQLLTKAKRIDPSTLKKDLKRQAEVLEETLHSFGIEAKVGQINCGPTITSFEVHPSIGVKVQRIRALEHDIALNMEARSIRIIAPIPGKAAVGIEVPNSHPQEVGFRELLAAYQRGEKRHAIPVLLGKTVAGEDVVADLAKMPHCIIAGATGSGKSVCINSMIMSILMNSKPDEVRLLMVDPKKVELTPYSRLPHMIAPVITESQGACAALNWLVKEMERRYEILKQVGARNIAGFNSRTKDLDRESELPIDIPEHLPYIVGIIDELADLMMVASSDIETPIARIAQMARAVGIHLILATQRPSREVITGIIKANFPTRIAFKVASRINSQIILDETGAESLLGNGDMLFLPPGSSNLIRAQGVFVRDEDIRETVQSICKQAPPNYLFESFDRINDPSLYLGPEEEVEQERDRLYDQALQTILQTGNASTTFLQRKLKIGYARAASIMDQLEAAGVVGPSEGGKPRQILMGGRSNSEDKSSLEEETYAE